MLNNKTNRTSHTKLVLGLGISFIMLGSAYASSKITIEPNKLMDTTLLIDIVPNLCRMNKNYAKLRQCKEGKPYVVSRLTFSNNLTCESKIPEIRLSPVQAQVLEKLMPDQKMQKLAWQKYGSCSGLSSSRYFRKIIQQANKLHLVEEIKDGKSYIINQAKLRQKLIDSNTGLIKDSIRFFCHNNDNTTSDQQILTHIKVCYRNGQYYPCQPEKTERNKQAVCQSTMVSIAQS